MTFHLGDYLMRLKRIYIEFLVSEFVYHGILISSHGVQASLTLECLHRFRCCDSPSSASPSLLSLSCSLSSPEAFLVALSLFLFNLDPPQKPSTSVPVKELRTTLDGKHWALDEAKRPSCRSQPPAEGPSLPSASGVDLSRAPSKPRTLSSAHPVIPPRVLFHSPLSGASSAGSGPAPTVIPGGDTLVGPSLSALSSAPSSPSDSPLSGPPLGADQDNGVPPGTPPVVSTIHGDSTDAGESTDDGDNTIIFNPHSVLPDGNPSARSDRSCVIFHPHSASSGVDVSSVSSPGSFDRSFFGDCVPLGLSGSDLLAGSSAVLFDTAAA